MKNIKNIVVAFTTLFTLTTLNASTGVFDFETLDGTARDWIEGSGNGNQAMWNTPGWRSSSYASSYWETYSTSGAYGYLASGNWCGGVISNSTSNTGTNASSDLNTVVGGGSGGSSNFGVLFLYDMMGQYTGSVQPQTNVTTTVDGKTFSNLCSVGITDIENFSFVSEESLNFSSIDLSLNVYTYDNLLNGDGMSAGTIGNTPNSAYILRIYGLDNNFKIIEDNYIENLLAYNYDDEVFIQNDWQTVSLAGLNNGEAVNGLAFEVLTSFANAYGPTTASMVAIDNIAYGTAVPEPAEWATIFGGIALAFVILRNRVKK
ncbi:MAG: DUF4465 domain-containing protein [Opitutales bacterium]|nr:DUF4465 domain-containing protein [Opitutales bacterium]